MRPHCASECSHALQPRAKRSRSDLRQVEHASDSQDTQLDAVAKISSVCTWVSTAGLACWSGYAHACVQCWWICLRLVMQGRCGDRGLVSSDISSKVCLDTPLTTESCPRWCQSTDKEFVQEICPDYVYCALQKHCDAMFTSVLPLGSLQASQPHQDSWKHSKHFTATELLARVERKL